MGILTKSLSRSAVDYIERASGVEITDKKALTEHYETFIFEFIDHPKIQEMYNQY